MKNFLLGTVVILGFLMTSATAGCSQGAATTSAKGIRHISAKEFKAAMEKKGVVLLDIRTPREFNAEHLKGAKMINFYDKSFADEIKKLDRNKSYLIYCHSGNRTGQALKLFQKLGFKDVADLAHGINAWHQAKYEVVR